MSRKSSRILKSDSTENLKQGPSILNRKRKSDVTIEEYDKDGRATRNRQPCQEMNPYTVDEECSTPGKSTDSFTSLESFRTTLRRTSSKVVSSSTGRKNPLPSYKWAESSDVWALLCSKERVYKRNHDYMLGHPSLQPRMRAILLDWLIEVCEVYRLHRETYYLAMDFIDRYLASQADIPKQQLQLIGITCLFIAAKMEEIYPPKLTEFAYVTDGACTEVEILAKELVIMKSLKWELTPATVNSWLSIYLQVANHLEEKELSETKENRRMIELKKFSSLTFVQAAQLLDLCTLDVLSLRYPYSVIAAAAVYHIAGERTALQASGYSWEDISSCIYWMTPYALGLREMGPAEVKTFPSIPLEDSHNIQTHAIDLQIYENVQNRLSEPAVVPQSPPMQPPGMLTPPHSKNRTKPGSPVASVTNTGHAHTLNTPSSIASGSSADWDFASPSHFH